MSPSASVSPSVSPSAPAGEYAKNASLYKIIEEEEGLSIKLGQTKIPTWNTAGRPTGVTGALGYNTETDQLEIYDGSAWQNIANDADLDTHIADTSDPHGATQTISTALGIGTTTPQEALSLATTKKMALYGTADETTNWAALKAWYEANDGGYIQVAKNGSGYNGSLYLGTNASGSLMAFSPNGDMSFYPPTNRAVWFFSAGTGSYSAFANQLTFWNSTEGYNCAFNIKSRRFITGTLSGATVNIACQIPSGAMLFGAQFNVDIAITGATSWSAAYNTGSTTSLGTGYALTLNTKVNKLVVPEITTAATDITLTAAGSDFTGGKIECVVYYIDLDPMGNA